MTQAYPVTVIGEDEPELAYPPTEVYKDLESVTVIKPESMTLVTASLALVYQFEDEWDRQILNDVNAGNLDSLAREALGEYRAGLTKPFPPDEEPSDV